MPVHFTLQDPSVTKMRRSEFQSRDMNKKFVKWLYRKGYLDKYKDVMNLERARRGRIPKGFDVHHIVPLSGGGTNHVSNLCLIEQSFHLFLNKKCFDPALRNIKIGESVDIQIPDLGRVATRGEYNWFIDQKLAHAKDREAFYRYMRKFK